jgi:predicted ATPase/signal transduction histidine kinase
MGQAFGVADDTYTITDELHVGVAHRLFRAVDRRDNSRVVLKCIDADRRNDSVVARLRREFAILRSLDVPGVVTAKELREDGDELRLVLVDVGGQNLATHMQRHGRLSLQAGLAIALQLATILGHLHSRGVSHRDIKPRNILVDDAGRVQLIDFGIATRLVRETPDQIAANGLQGTLAYISPEQTGRTSRAVDHRTDLYSLGATLYELFTGSPPFQAADPAAMIHCHIAREPVAPLVREPSLPAALSAIIMKLLAKAAEDRYRSAFGLASDLERVKAACLAGATPQFTLAEHDPPLLFQIPDELYGRERERDALTAVVQRARDGGAELVLLRGPAGAGKATLVRELRRHLSGKPGLFAAGKHDTLGRDAPYAALCGAFGELLRGLMAEPDDVVARWRWTLDRSLGATADALIPLIPELGTLLGRRVTTELDLGGDAARNRLSRAMFTLVRALTAPQAPLVLFLDDFQAADPASLEVLIAVLGEVGGAGLCCIGSCRVEEGVARPAFDDALRTAAAWCRVTTIDFPPLPNTAIAAIIAATIALPVAAVMPLAEVIAARTGGSAYFVAELLRSLHSAGIIRFDAEAAAWTFSLADAAAFPVTANVVDLLLARIEGLPPATRHALQRAACIADLFTEADLVDAGAGAMEEVSAALVTATQVGLCEHVGVAYRFAHDRVREALYATLSTDARVAMHLAIGRHWRARQVGNEVHEDRLFAVVDQLGLGLPGLVEVGERRELAGLALQAAQRARASAAFSAAASRCALGLRALGDDAWSREPRLAYALSRLECECGSIDGDLARGEALTNALLRRCTSAEDQAEVLITRAGLHLARGELEAALQVARRTARLLGDDLPRPGMMWVIVGVIQTERAIARRTPDALLQLPEMVERRQQLLVKTLSVSLGSAFQVDMSLMMALTLKLMRLALRDGISSAVAPAFVVYGIVAGAPRRDYHKMDSFGRAGLKLLDRFPDPAMRPLVGFLYSGLIQPMVYPYHECVQNLRDHIRQGLEVGANTAAGYCWGALLTDMVCGGLGLDDLRVESDTALQFLPRAGVGPVLWNARLDRGFALALLGESAAPGSLSYAGFDASACETTTTGEVSPLSRYSFWHRSLVVQFVLGDHDAALATLAKADPGVEAAFRFFNAFFDYRGFRGLLLAASTPPDAGFLARQRLARELRTTLEELTAPAASCPANFAAMRALIAAELARVEERNDAPEAYEAAITLAREHGTPHLEAIACERAGRYYLGRRVNEAGQAYLVRARRAYTRWGAKAKNTRLLAEFAFLRLDRLPGPAGTMADVSVTLTREASPSVSGSGVSSRSDHVVDVASMVKAAQAFAAEIDIATLAAKVMRIIVENAGAERGTLLLVEAAGLVAVADYSTRTDVVRMLGNVALETLGDLPVSLVLRAFRGGKALAFDDAASDPSSSEDSYVQRRRLRSALCAPLIVQGRSVGAIYLENNLATGVFTAQRIDVLQLLAVQAAIAVEQANFFRRLDAARLAAEAANHAKSLFLANMSHELRTPLNAILGYSELLAEDAAAQGQAAMVADLARIEQAGRHLLGIIGDILDLTKIEAGRLDLAHVPVVVAELLDEVAAVTRLEHGANRLIREQDPDLGVITTDPGKLRQVLLNLLSNADKFTEHGAITLRVHRSTKTLRFEVQDTGIGINPAQLATVFDPFVQADPSSTRRYGGVGLGLTICKRLCEQLGGSLTATSVPGVGSTFAVSLPVHPDLPGLAPSPVALPPDPLPALPADPSAGRGHPPHRAPPHPPTQDAPHRR